MVHSTRVNVQVRHRTNDEPDPELIVNSTLQRVTGGETPSVEGVGSLLREFRLNPEAKEFKPREIKKPTSKRTLRSKRRFQRFVRLRILRLRVLHVENLIDMLDKGEMGVEDHFIEWGRDIASFVEYDVWSPYTCQDGIFRDSVVHTAAISFATHLSRDPVVRRYGFLGALRADRSLLEDLSGTRSWEEFQLMVTLGRGVRKDRKPPALRELAASIAEYFGTAGPGGRPLSYQEETLLPSAQESGSDDEDWSDEDDPPFYEHDDHGYDSQFGIRLW